jgi:hypothetical protein
MKRDIQHIDDDIIRKKRKIAQALYSDPDIVEILDDSDIDPSCPEELVYSSIYPFLRIPGTQDTVKNFITFTIDDSERLQNNKVMKSQYVQFVVFVHRGSIKTQYGMERHDLLGYLIRDIFNLSNMLGPQMELANNKEGATDTNYLTRTLRFELIDDNSTKPCRTNPYEYDRIVGHRR